MIHLICFKIKLVTRSQDIIQNENLSMLHLNVRSINSNFDDFKNLIEESKQVFNIICLSETWSSDKSFRDNSNYHLLNYFAIPFERINNKHGGGLLIYVKENLMHNVRNDLSISDGDREFLSIEIVNKCSKNYIVTCCYRPPNFNIKQFTLYLNRIFEKS